MSYNRRKDNARDYVWIFLTALAGIIYLYFGSRFYYDHYTLKKWGNSPDTSAAVIAVLFNLLTGGFITAVVFLILSIKRGFIDKD